MPLSEHEQKLLDQMERAILTEDPRFASTFRDTLKNVSKKSETSPNFALVIVGIVFGVMALLAGVSISQPLLGVLGFVVIVLSLSSLRGAKASWKKKSSTPSTKSRKSFMQGIEERWDNRADN